MRVGGALGITQFHCIYLWESCIKYGILKTEKIYEEREENNLR